MVIDIKEAAHRLGKSEKTLRRWAHTGKIPYHPDDTGRLMFAVSDIEAHQVAPSDSQRIELLEQRVNDLEKKVARLEQARRPPPTKVLRPPRIPYQAEAPAPGEGLPAGYVPVVDLIKRYHAPETSVMRYFRSYEEGKHLHQGNWKASDGRTIKLALDQEGQAEFMRLYHGDKS